MNSCTGPIWQFNNAIPPDEDGQIKLLDPEDIGAFQ